MNDTRRLILKILLWSLGATAIAGIGAVLLESAIVGRAAGSAFSTSAIALLMLALLARMTKPEFQSGAILGIVALTVVWLLTLAIIWELGDFLDLDSGFRFFGTIWIIIGCAALGMVYLRLWNWPFAAVAGVVGLCVTAAVFVMLMLGTWSDGRWGYGDKWFVSAWAMLLCTLPAVISLLGLNVPVGTFAGSDATPTGSLRHWRWIGVVGGTASLLIALVGTWNEIHSDGTLFVTVTGCGAFPAFLHFVLLTPLKPSQRWLGIGTIASGALLLAMVELAVWTDAQGDDLFARLIGAAIIATTCGSLALLVLSRLNRKAEFVVVSASEYLRVTLLCPRCHRKQDLPLGGAACEGCGLKIEVKVEEPRCTQCGYLLFMLRGDRCPECGAAIERPANGEAASAGATAM